MLKQLFLLAAFGLLYSHCLGAVLTSDSSLSLCKQLDGTFGSAIVFPNDTEYSTLRTENW